MATVATLAAYSLKSIVVARPSLRAVEEPVHVHDFHATILHLMGLDHTKLTYRHAGRDYRLTDVVRELLA